MLTSSGQGSNMALMFSRNFVVSTAERAIKTAAQVALGLLTVDLVLAPQDIREAVATVAVATIASVLSSIASTSVGDPGDPSAV